MKKLDKILEELNYRINEYVDHDYVRGSGDVVKGLSIAKSIIRKHMSDKDTDVPTNDGWISVDDRLPEVFGKYWATIRYSDGRISEPVVVDFRGVQEKYVVDTPNGREYETWGIDSAFHGSRVIAWKPYYIPEPYRPERSE